MMPGTPILYGFTDLTDLRITMVKQEGSFRPARKQTKLSYKTVSSQAATRDPVFWKQPAISETNHTQTTLLRHPGGWQNSFATETGGLSPTGNSVASAEQTSAALYLKSHK